MSVLDLLVKPQCASQQIASFFLSASMELLHLLLEPQVAFLLRHSLESSTCEPYAKHGHHPWEDPTKNVQQKPQGIFTSIEFSWFCTPHPRCAAQGRLALKLHIRRKKRTFSSSTLGHERHTLLLVTFLIFGKVKNGAHESSLYCEMQH